MNFYVICTVLFIWALPFALWGHIDMSISEPETQQLEPKYDARHQTKSACIAYLKRVNLEEKEQTK